MSSARQEHDVVAEAFDKVAWKVENSPQILQRRETVDLRTGLDYPRGERVVDPRQAAQRTCRGIVDVDQPGVERAVAVRTSDADLGCQGRLLSRDSHCLLPSG